MTGKSWGLAGGTGLSAEEVQFWSVEARRKTLIQCSSEIAEKAQHSEERLEKYFLEAGVEVRPDARAMRRMHAGTQKGVRVVGEYTGWLKGLVTLADDDGLRAQIGADTMAKLTALAEEFAECLGRPVREEGGVRVPPSVEEWTIFSALLQRYLFVKADDLVAVRECFFTTERAEEGAKEELHFRMYRYHSNTGRIAKSFTTIHGPTTASRACTFANFFKESPAMIEPRRASGIILPMGSVLHFLGEIDSGKGLKIMTIERPERPRHWYSGLLMSFDGAKTPIISRFVIRRVEDANHQGVDIGIHDEASLAKEIEEFRDDLINVGDGEVAQESFGRHAIRARSHG